MKAWYLYLLLLFITVTSFTGNNNQPDKTLELFKQVSDNLNKLQTIQYKYLREFNYPSEGYKANSEGDAYFDFTTDTALAGFRYQYNTVNSIVVFNGTEYFSADKKNRTLSLSTKRQPKSFEGQSALFNSIATLRNSLPAIIKDEDIAKTVRDTLFKNQDCYVLKFTLVNKLLTYIGKSFTPTTVSISFNYNMVVNKATLLPIALLQINPKNNDLNRTDFVGLDIKPAKPNEQSWYYSSYLDQYVPEKSKQPINLIKVGEQAPDWHLTNLSDQKANSLASYKGKVSLIEFWIKNCGYCIAAAPKLNAIKQKYGKKLNLLAINTEDPVNMIEVFKNKHKVQYDIFFGQADIDQKYGVSGYPTVVLIDKNGKVLYSKDSLDQQELEAAIRKATM